MHHDVDLTCFSSGQPGGAQHHEDRGEAYEGSAVQQGVQHAVVGKEEAGDAERHEGERGRDQGLQRNAEPAAEDQRAGETETEVKISCEPISHFPAAFAHLVECYHVHVILLSSG